MTSRPFYGRKLWVSEGKHRGADGKWHYDAEIDLLGTGRQVVLPPSIHPDTLKPYRWERPLDLDAADLGLPCAPEISADYIAKLTEAVTDTYKFESIEPLTFRPGQLEAELREIPDSRIDDYHSWIALGQALHHQFGGGRRGYDLWLEHSKRSEKFSEREMTGKWRGFGRSRRVPVTMASVRQWVLETRRERTLSEFDEVDAFDGPPTAPPTVTDDDLLGGDPAPATAADGMNSAGSKTCTQPNWRSLLDPKENGAWRATLHNIELIVGNDPRCEGLLEFNELSGDIVFRRTPVPWNPPRRGAAKPVRQLDPSIWRVSDQVNGELWSDCHGHDIRRIFEAPKGQGGYGIRIPEKDMLAATALVARTRAFHPIRDYLSSLKWDGVPRLETMFIDYLGAPDDAYHREVARLAMVAAVTRVEEPGAQFHQVIILEGPQGIRKSTFIRILGRGWGAELEGDFSNAQQMLERLRGKWIIEIPELAGFKGTDVRHLKAFVSRAEDRARMVYERNQSNVKRQCILWASTNESQYLRDDTGGRRWWPVKCGAAAIDTDRLSKEIDQIWAEAAVIYRQMRRDQPSGELPLYLTDAEAATIALEIQDSRRVESQEASHAGEIEAWLNRPISTGGFDSDESGIRVVTCQAEIWHECLGHLGKKDTRQGLILGKALSMIPGWTQRGNHTFEKYGRQKAYWRDGYTAADLCLGRVTTGGTPDETASRLRLVSS
jgi:predicted P-loop ATPase